MIVIQFDFLEGKQAGNSCVVRRFPFRVGRVATSDLILHEEGVWDEHAEIRLQWPDIVVSALPGTIVSVNGEPVTEVVLSSGDVIDLGAVKLRFGLSPSQQKSLTGRETFVWLIYLSLFVAEAALIFWLVAG